MFSIDKKCRVSFVYAAINGGYDNILKKYDNIFLIFYNIA